jgi:hypothetical protein
MAKAAKQKIQNKEDEARKPEDDNVVAEAFDDANAAVGNDSYYADDGADTDYPPDEGDYNVADYSPDDGDDTRQGRRFPRSRSSGCGRAASG